MLAFCTVIFIFFYFLILYFVRNLDENSPSKGFGSGEFTGASSSNIGGTTAAPKLHELDIALGLSGSTAATKKVWFFHVC